MNMTPIAQDDVFTATQGQFTTTISGNLGVDNGHGADADPDGTVLGWWSTPFDPAGNGDRFLGAFFNSVGQLSFLTIAGTVSYPFPQIVTATMLTTAQGGQVIMDTSGGFTYTAAAGFSGTGSDDLHGEGGADKLLGGAGADKLYGGAGNDQFRFDGPGGSHDKVMDFKAGDKLTVRAADYGLAAGALPDASYFALAGAANVDHGRFVYASANRGLSWDADGNLATANTLIATFDKAVSLSGADFLVI